MKQFEVNPSVCVETTADLQFNGAVGGREETRERPSHPPNAWADKAVNCSSSSSIRVSNNKQTKTIIFLLSFKKNAGQR